MDDAALARALPGAWTLLKWEIAYSDGRASGYPYGNDATGLLLYTPDGHMSACVSRTRRARLDGASARHAPAGQKCAAFDGYFHYQGRYRVADGAVLHEVSESLNPNFPGTTQRRDAQLQNGSLVLSAQDTLPGSSVVRTHRLCWRRAGA